MASKKKTDITSPSRSKRAGGASSIQNLPALRRRKWEQLKERFGTESKFIQDGMWRTIDQNGDTIGMILPVEINQDLTKDSYTDIALQLEEAIEELGTEWNGHEPLFWTSIELYEYSRQKMGSGPKAMYDQVNVPMKDSEYARTMDGTPGVPANEVLALFRQKMTKYMTNRNSYTHVTKIVVNVREKRK